MNKTIRLYICCLLFLGCSDLVILKDDLEFKEFKYFNKGNDKPFSGTAVIKFDNGKVSNSIRFKNGIPDGKWEAYGYQGEIVQEGRYTPVPIDDSDKLFENIKRISVYFFKEGEFKTNDILVILKKDNRQFNRSDELRAGILKYLNFNDKSLLENAKLDSIIFVKGELEITN